MGLREDILAEKATLKSETVEVAGRNVLICEMTAGGRLDSLELVKDGKVELRDLYPTLIIAGLRDPETHELIFSDDDKEAILKMMGWDALEEIANKISSMSGIKAGSDEEAEKNSLTTPNSTGSTV